ncbi:tyrosine-type recombinase/integrase [Streptomyces sp. NBC_00069]|uniref:tyrosine-type recombinase/integrase n=1 Tax=Streptomyces sp. NBC_00069 TaxID=2975639 RepID=UPI003862EA67
MAGKRRQFGRVRKLPSGRYQARYLGPDGQLRPAPETFRTKRDADDWLADKQTEMRRGDWQDPAAGKVAFGPYAVAWIKERELTGTTWQLYGSLLKHHLEPVLGAVNLAEISPPLVRSWRADKLAGGTGPTTVAKAYALLRAILGTAVSDELIRRNPCQVKGASTVHTPERPTATVQEVYALAGAVQPRFRALVLMAGFLGLRWGELIGLHRRDIDLDRGTLRVRCRRRAGERAAGDQGAQERGREADRLHSRGDRSGDPAPPGDVRRGRCRRARVHRGQGGDSSTEPLQPAVAQGVPEGRDQGAAFP